jgi:hypothetical protein
MAMVVSGSHHPIRDGLSQFWKNRRATKAVRLMERARIAEQRARLCEECLTQIQTDQDRLTRESSDYLSSGRKVPEYISESISHNESARISAREYFANN